MRYTVAVAPAAAKAIRRLDRNIARRIGDAIDGLAEDPRPHGVKKLQADANLWRIRVGNYRIVYEIRDKQLFVLVLAAGHRREVYR